jgi:rhodanese-related sulfurtransferase
MKKLYLILTLVIMASLVLSACGGQPEPVVEETAPEEVVVEEVAEEPEATEAPPEPMAAGPEALDGEFGRMLAEMVKYNTIKDDGLLEEMAADTPPFILDVRTLDEVTESGHIEGAAFITLTELAQHIDLLPSLDTPIVAYCAGGWRATIAMTALYGMGFEDVRALKVGFADWKDAGNPVVEGVPEAVALNAATVDESLVMAADAYLVGVKDHGTKWGILSADDLNLAIAENADLVVIDVRTQGEVDEKGYIESPNWIHIPIESFIASRADWPAMDAPIAIYCGSGHRSTMAMTIMFAYGYGDVTSLSGGFGGWLGAGYAVAGGIPDFAVVLGEMLSNMAGYNTIKADGLLVEMTEDQPPFLLDVRTTEEVETNGHIEGAAHIPLAELGQHADLLPAFDTPIVVYCGSGWRATIAMPTLYGMGYTDVRAFKTTFADWVAAGNPVVEGLPEAMVLDAVEIPANVLAAVDASMAVYGVKPYAGISGEDFNTALIEDGLIVMDVRRAEELTEKGVVDVGEAEFIALPIEQFAAEMAQWPADKDAKIVVYCGSGHRSTMVVAMMGLNGYTNVWSLKGGFGGWVEAGYPVAEYAAP